MSDRTRQRGRFIKKKVLAKKMKALAASLQARTPQARTDRENLEVSPCYGRRIVELTELGKNLRCCQCFKILSLENIVKETRLGLNSCLTVSCESCCVNTSVLTGKMHTSKNDAKLSDVNTKIVLGAVHAGIGFTALTKLLACLNIPPLTDNLFKRYERELGPAIEECAKESCQRAAEEERKLVIENVEKLCDEMPPEIVEAIYPHLHDLEPATNSDNHETLNEDSIMLKTAEKFDAALGNIVNIIVSYDMGWSKRGNGRSYDSLNGYGAIIGFFSGKVLDYATRNRKCKFCDAGRSKEDHDCRLNFQGSAKAMEPDVGAELVNRSTVLKDAGLNVRVLIGDEDSSTIAAVRRGNSQQIFKLADTNHLRKHFVSELYEVQKTYKEMKKKEAIPHLKKCFGYAVAQNKGKSVDLANCLRSIPDHFFDRHENCGHWCLRRCDSSGVQKVVFQDPGLYEKLNEIFTKYANNAAKFSVAASSQANESLNNIMSHKAPKNRCYSLSESADFRFSSAVCAKNDGESYLLAVSEKVRISPGKNTATFIAKQQLKRSERASKAKLPSTKSRRNILAEKRQALRKKAEQAERIQYQSNCGFDMEINDLGNNFTEDMNNNNMENPLPGDSSFIFFDLETSGLHKSADILQIAAKCGESTFSEYANPSQPITPSATAITGLRNVAGELFLYDQRLPSIPIHEVLRKFEEWLDVFKPCILVAHNAKFDTPRLLHALKKNSMIEDFKNVIAAFADTLVILRKLHPQRKGPGMFKLSRLAEDLLHIEPTTKFHEASYDVDILEKIASTIPKEKLIANSKSFTECFVHEACLQKAAVLERSLNVFKGVISAGMIRKIASAGIDNTKIQKVYAESGREGIVQLLSTNQPDKKPRVTKDKKILGKILEFLETNQSSAIV